MTKSSRSILGVPFLLAVAASAQAGDWRQEASEDVQRQNLIKLVPGASHWMIEMGERYKNLFWAAKLGKWEFAQYQAEEIESLVQTMALARPKRAQSAEIFLQKVFPSLHQAVGSKDWARFQSAFRGLNSECIACHVREDHDFIVIPAEPASANSPVLNLK